MSEPLTSFEDHQRHLNKQWGVSRADMDSFTDNPETGQTEHVVYVYPPDGQRIPVFGEGNRERADMIALRMNTPDLGERARTLATALENLLENSPRPPEPNCSCHLSPPCDDCVTWTSLREAIKDAEDVLNPS